ncbi:MAG: LexA family transcriptional regulator [Erysipelotrichaceae bacterium]|nr:LexA family transcriptional regulator [Erysipelotrichaceae bacterium]
MGFKERLKEARLSSGLTQEQLAEKIGVAKSTLTGYEKGNREPDMAKIAKIIDTLNVNADFLFQDDMQNLTELVITLDERRHIKKYRSLEDHGKDIVDTILDKEYDHAIALKKQSETEHIQEPNPDYQYLIDKDKLYMTQYDYGVSAGIGNYLDEWDVPKTTVQIADSPTARKADYILKVDGDSMMPKFDDGDRVFVKAQETVEINEIGIFVIDGTCFLKQFKGDCLHSINPTYDDIALNEFQNIKCVGKVIGKV